MKLECLDHVAISVRDVTLSVAWYRDVLGLERLHQDAWGDRPAVVGAGDTGLALSPVPGGDGAGGGEGSVGHQVPGMRHVAFRTDAAGFAAAQSHLRERGVPYTFEDHGISHSIYVLDPDGHRIEVTTYLPAAG